MCRNDRIFEKEKCSIELVLVVRNPANQRIEALWIEPMIYLKY